MVWRVSSVIESVSCVLCFSRNFCAALIPRPVAKNNTPPRAPKIGMTGFATFQYDIVRQKFYSGDFNNPIFAFNSKVDSFGGLPEGTKEQF